MDFTSSLCSRMRTYRIQKQWYFRSQDRKCYKLPKGIVSMRTKLGNWTRLAVVVVAMAGTQAGCKSGWKMPGSDMFPWSKKPSESTLAGSSPGLSMPTSNSASPMGPSYKNTPSTLANSNTGMNKSASPYGTAIASGPNFNMPPNNAMASNHGPSMPSMPNGAGVASGANGYATGPYNMAGTANRSGGYTPQTGYGVPPQLPNGFGTTPPQNSMANSMPPAYGGPAGMPPPASTSTYSPMGNGNPTNAMNVGYNAMVNTNPAPSSMPNALPGSYQQPSGAPVTNQTYAGAAPYRPGSVGRQTSYDFSNPGAGSTGMPPANVPNTANGMPNSVYR